MMVDARSMQNKTVSLIRFTVGFIMSNYISQAVTWNGCCIVDLQSEGLWFDSLHVTFFFLLFVFVVYLLDQSLVFHMDCSLIYKIKFNPQD